MKILLLRILAAAFFTGIAAPDATAQTRGYGVSVDVMTGKSDVIGVATIQGAVCRLEERTGAICTDITVTFTDVWKGEPESKFILVKPGGKIGDREYAIPDQEYSFTVGEKMVVFASPNKFGNHSPVGIRWGLYRVGEGPDHPLFRVSDYPIGAGTTSPLKLQALKDQVRKAMGVSTDPVPTTPPSSPKSNSAESVPAGASGEAPSAPSARPGSPSDPTPQTAGGDFRSWGGYFIIFLIVVLATGVILTRRKSA